MPWWKFAADETKFAAEKMAKTNLFETDRMFCDVYGLEPGQSQKPHVHADADKVYYVLEGEGLFEVSHEQRILGPGAVVHAAAGAPHGVTNTGTKRLALLVVMAPHPQFRKI
ncbi:MAG: cupin domain-containing protein [Planctomycetia bacterium]|nr:cupin domain-containing protein [Planctomycetia bacterium]